MTTVRKSRAQRLVIIAAAVFSLAVVAFPAAASASPAGPSRVADHCHGNDGNGNGNGDQGCTTTTTSSTSTTQPTNCNGKHPPYGCTTTTKPPKPPHCATGSAAAKPDTMMVLACKGVAAGTPVQVFLGGHQVADGVTQPGNGGIGPAAAGTAQVFNGPTAAGPATLGDAPDVESYISFPVPDLKSGRYDVVVTGQAFNATAGSFKVVGGSGTAAGVPAKPSLAHRVMADGVWALALLLLAGFGYLVVRSRHGAGHHHRHHHHRRRHAGL